MPETTQVDNPGLSTEELNPERSIIALMGRVPEHVVVVPGLKKASGAQYEIVRGLRHDGTVIFTHQLIEMVLRPVLEGRSFYKSEPPLQGERMRYEVGMITLDTEYGLVDVPAGRIPGMTQTARMPVRATLISE